MITVSKDIRPQDNSPSEKPPSSAKELGERFQCQGCVSGNDTSCGSYRPEYCGDFMSCKGHVLGTIAGAGNFALGLPKGFCSPGINYEANLPRTRNRINMRLWPERTKPTWCKLNVPVWAMVREGFLFVRTFLPRINVSYVDIIEHGIMEMVPNAIDISEFIDEID